VGLKEGGSQEQPRGVDKGVFQRMCVFHGPAVGLLVLMVQLVDVLVQERSVECSVKPVEAEVFNQQKQRYLDCYLLPVWKVKRSMPWFHYLSCRKHT